MFTRVSVSKWTKVEIILGLYLSQHPRKFHRIIDMKGFFVIIFLEVFTPSVYLLELFFLFLSSREISRRVFAVGEISRSMTRVAVAILNLRNKEPSLRLFLSKGNFWSVGIEHLIFVCFRRQSNCSGFRRDFGLRDGKLSL